MGLPDKAIFEDFLQSFEMKIQPYEIDDLCQNKLSQDSIEKLLDNLDIQYNQHHQNIVKHELNQWFKKQNNFLKAITSLYVRYKPPTSKYKTVEEYKTERLELILERLNNNKRMEYDFSSIKPDINESELLQQANGDPIEFQRLLKNQELYLEVLKERTKNNIVDNILRFYRPYKDFKLHHSIYKCFYDYFYTDRATKLYDAKIRSNKILKTLELNLEEFLKLKDFEQFLFHSDSKKLSNAMNSAANRFEASIKNSSFIFPFERKDETLKERVLIYDLHKLFNQYFKQSKPNVIFYLLMVEGVKNNIEKRNIERMISKWKTDI